MSVKSYLITGKHKLWVSGTWSTSLHCREGFWEHISRVIETPELINDTPTSKVLHRINLSLQNSPVQKFYFYFHFIYFFYYFCSENES